MRSITITSICRPDRLAKVRDGAGEWDREYAEIVNGVLPFASCVAHVGGEGWGQDGFSFGDVQMRAYLVGSSPQQIRVRMATEGPSRAFRFSKKVSLSRSKFKKWQRVTLSYDHWYSDYGGTANIDIFARTFGTQTVVLVFMYEEPREQIVDIVKSFQWKT